MTDRFKHLTVPTLKDPCPGHPRIQGMMGNVVRLGGLAVSTVATVGIEMIMESLLTSS